MNWTSIIIAVVTIMATALHNWLVTMWPEFPLASSDFVAVVIWIVLTLAGLTTTVLVRSTRLTARRQADVNQLVNHELVERNDRLATSLSIGTQVAGLTFISLNPVAHGTLAVASIVSLVIIVFYLVIKD